MSKISCNETWLSTEPPPCKLFQEPFHPRCPSGFIGFDDYCLIIKKSQFGNATCPHPSQADFTQFLQILELFNVENVWLPIQRNQPFGKFIYTTPNLFHQTYIPPNWSHQDCLILTKNQSGYSVQLANCSSTYDQICLYRIQDTYSTNNKAMRCTEKCYNIDRNCQKLAEPLSAEVNYVLKNLVGEQTCRFGLKRNQEETFHWPRLGEVPEYTDWVFDADYNKSVVTISKYGWDTRDEADCEVCEVDLNGREAGLSLRRSSGRNGLILTLYSPDFFMNVDKVACKVVGVDDYGLKFHVKKLRTTRHQKGFLENLSKEDKREVYFLEPNIEEYNYYKCEGIILPKGSLVSSQYVLFGTKDSKREYALHIIVQKSEQEDLLKDVLKKIDLDIIDHKRIVLILDVTKDNMQVIVHIRVKKSRLDLVDEYERIFYSLAYLFSKLNFLKLVSFRYAWGCLEEVKRNGGINLHWSFASFGTTVMPREMCLNHQGLPVTRRCIGDFIQGGKWEEESGECSPYVVLSTSTDIIYQTFSSSVSTEDTLKNLLLVTENCEKIIPSDIYYISQVLQKLETNSSSPKFVAQSLVSILSNLMAANRSSLKSSSELLNSTNILLDTFENLMRGIPWEFPISGVLQFIAPNMFYQISDPGAITGVAMSKSSKAGSSFKDYRFDPINSTDLETVMNFRDLEICTFVPESVVQNSSKVFIAVFSDNSLFFEDQDSGKLVDRVLSVSFDDTILSSPIPVIFRNRGNSQKKQCSYWNFGGSSFETRYSTKWSTDGGIYWSSPDVDVCGFTHLTHFALLLDPDITKGISGAYNDSHDDILSLITVIGCSLSIFGVCSIILSTILFESWRHKLGTKILLNFSCSTLLEIVVIFLASSKNFDVTSTSCLVFGVVLHYSVVSTFCWMLVVAFLQYLRFVKVIGGLPSRLLLKSCIIGWALPLVPVGGLLLWDLNSYTPIADIEQSTLCYPQSNVVYTTVLLPITIIIIINLVIFCFIIHSITRNSLPKRNQNKSLLIHQLKVAILLFFILGLTWIFGILAATQKCILCLYLFCSTATLQGFVLFLFFIVLDPTTRKLWISLISRIRSGKFKELTSISKSGESKNKEN